MKFAMEREALPQLAKQTAGAHQDLGAVVRQLAAAGAPVYGRMNGEGRAAFDAFASHSDEIATELDRALASVLDGIRGQAVSWAQGDVAMGDAIRSAQGRAGFESARFGGGA